MKNRILAALLALVLGVPLYLLAADAVPTAAAKTVSSAAPAQAVALLKALPSAEDLAAAMTPETDAAAMIAQTRADLQREIERQTGPKGIDLSWWQSHYNDIIGYIYSPGTPISYPIAYDGNKRVLPPPRPVRQLQRIRHHLPGCPRAQRLLRPQQRALWPPYVRRLHVRLHLQL